VLILASTPSRADDAFVAIPPADAARDHIDNARHNKPSPEAERAARDGLERAYTELESFRGRSTESAATLLAVLRARDAAEVEWMRHYTYLFLRHAIDTRDGASGEQAADLDAEFTRRSEFLWREVGELAPDVFERYTTHEPALATYAGAVAAARRDQPHRLPLVTEEALDALSPVVRDRPYELWQALVARTDFGSVAAAGGTLEVLRQRSAIANDADPAVRRAGFERYYAGFATQRDLYAFALADLVKGRDTLARLHGFADAPEEVYFASYWTTQQVRDLLERVAGLADVYRRYQRMRIEHLHARGIADVGPWDMTAQTGAAAPRFTIAQGPRVLRTALAPLGPEYGRQLAALLDPANGRMDIVPGPNRQSGGFSRGFPGMANVFYSAGYAGSYEDLRVLAHESTHAIQRQLLSDAHVPPVYADGPGFLFESVAMLSELLLPDYLYAHARNDAERRYYLERFFEGKGMAMFFVAQDAALEQALHEGIVRGDVRGADDLDRLATEINARYSIWGPEHPQLAERWMTDRLFYEDPFYDINYVFGAALALEYYARLHGDPRGFARRYQALLANGFDAPPATLLRRFLDIDLEDPKLADDAAAALSTRLDELQAAYDREERASSRGGDAARRSAARN
jgi:oligoendopeptidase F